MAVRVLDVHAHITPGSALRAMQSGDNWFGITAPALYNQHRYNPRTFWTPEQRIADMQSLGVDVHVLSSNASLYFYDLDTDQTMAIHRECNDYVAQLSEEYPTGSPASPTCRCRTSAPLSRNSPAPSNSWDSRAQ